MRMLQVKDFSFSLTPAVRARFELFRRALDVQQHGGGMSNLKTKQTEHIGTLAKNTGGTFQKPTPPGRSVGSRHAAANRPGSGPGKLPPVGSKHADNRAASGRVGSGSGRPTQGQGQRGGERDGRTRGKP